MGKRFGKSVFIAMLLCLSWLLLPGGELGEKHQGRRGD